VNRVPVARKAEGEVVALPDDEPLRLECLHFVECVRDRKNPRTDGENGLEVLKILHAAGRSIRNNGLPADVDGKAAPAYFAHPSAIIDSPSKIGKGTKIWHFSHIMADSSIGKHCVLGQNVHVASGVRIGDHVKIQNNVSLYDGVELENDVFCGPSMVFTNVITPRSRVNRKSEFRRTLVKRGATLGANSTIVCGTTVGQYAFVGAGAVVTRDVPDYALVVGVPARCVGWVCRCGVRLELSASVGLCSSCGNTYSLDQGAIVDLAPMSSRVSAPRALAAAVGEAKIRVGASQASLPIHPSSPLCESEP
jgi:UDP-2-acetamido-3-amino-2,3-dideoxy-glucuronate N-acetyltransferase